MKKWFLRLKRNFWLLKEKMLSWLRKIGIMPKVVYYTVFELKIYGDELIMPLLLSANNDKKAKIYIAEFNLSLVTVYDDVKHTIPHNISLKEFLDKSFIKKTINGTPVKLEVFVPNESLRPKKIVQVSDLGYNIVFEEELIVENKIDKGKPISRELIAYVQGEDSTFSHATAKRIKEGYDAIVVPSSLLK